MLSYHKYTVWASSSVQWCRVQTPDACKRAEDWSLRWLRLSAGGLVQGNSISVLCPCECLPLIDCSSLSLWLAGYSSSVRYRPLNIWYLTNKFMIIGRVWWLFLCCCCSSVIPGKILYYLVWPSSPLRSAIMRIPRVYGDGDDRGRDGTGQGWEWQWSTKRTTTSWLNPFGIHNKISPKDV